MTVAQTEIQDWVNDMARDFHPERIILFGSYADGVPTDDSDVDVLVVMEHETKGWRMAAEITGRCDPPFPVDMIVRTPQQMRERLAMGDPVLKDIVRSGEVLYEAGDR